MTCIHEHLIVAQDRQNKYTNAHHVDRKYSVGDKVVLRLCPQKSPMYYRKGSKLVPYFFGPFQILERIGPVAYHLAFPPSLSCIHDVFHVSVLKPYFPNVTHVLYWHALQEGDRQLFLEHVCILQHWG